MTFRVLDGWKEQTVADEIKIFIDGVVAREVHRRAKELDHLIESSLRKQFIGRVIVYLAAWKWMAAATLLSNLVRLEVRTFNDTTGMTTRFEVLYRGKIVGRIAFPECERTAETF
jgi:hypothetical protein